jgi:hypothetical protein
MFPKSKSKLKKNQVAPSSPVLPSSAEHSLDASNTATTRSSSLLASTILSKSRKELTPENDLLDEIDLKAFVTHILPSINTLTDYTDEENASINDSLEVNSLRLKDPRWKAQASYVLGCKQFTLTEDGNSIVIARAEGVVHCSAGHALGMSLILSLFLYLYLAS